MKSCVQKASMSLLERDLDMVACRLKRKPGVEDIMLAVDRELAEHGLLDSTACLFRGCHICLLQLPDNTCPAAKDSAQVCFSSLVTRQLPRMLCILLCWPSLSRRF